MRFSIKISQRRDLPPLSYSPFYFLSLSLSLSLLTLRRFHVSGREGRKKGPLKNKRNAAVIHIQRQEKGGPLLLRLPENKPTFSLARARTHTHGLSLTNSRVPFFFFFFFFFLFNLLGLMRTHRWRAISMASQNSWRNEKKGKTVLRADKFNFETST